MAGFKRSRGAGHGSAPGSPASICPPRQEERLVDSFDSTEAPSLRRTDSALDLSGAREASGVLRDGSRSPSPPPAWGRALHDPGRGPDAAAPRNVGISWPALAPDPVEVITAAVEVPAESARDDLSSNPTVLRAPTEERMTTVFGQEAPAESARAGLSSNPIVLRAPTEEEKIAIFGHRLGYGPNAHWFGFWPSGPASAGVFLPAHDPRAHFPPTRWQWFADGACEMPANQDATPVDNEAAEQEQRLKDLEGEVDAARADCNAAFELAEKAYYFATDELAKQVDQIRFDVRATHNGLEALRMDLGRPPQPQQLASQDVPAPLPEFVASGSASFTYGPAPPEAAWGEAQGEAQAMPRNLSHLSGRSGGSSPSRARARQPRQAPQPPPNLNYTQNVAWMQTVSSRLADQISSVRQLCSAVTLPESIRHDRAVC